jgi:hypothetical protein
MVTRVRPALPPSLCCLFLVAALSLPAPRAVYAGPEEFDVFNVTVEVLRQDGSPVTGALVRAVSDDWGWRHPREAWDWESTDGSGRATVALTRGAWTLVAAGDYAFTTAFPGRALFLAAPGTVIQGDTLITLRVDSESACTFRTVEGGPLHVEELRATLADRAPGWISATCGYATDGAVILETTLATGPALLGAVHRDIATEPVYMLHGTVAPGGALELAPAPGTVATLRFSSFDADGLPGPGNVEIRPPGFDANNFLWDFNTEPTRTLYNDFPRVTINHRFTHLPGEYFYFVGEVVDLAAGSDTSIAFGGALNAFLHVIPRNNADFGEQTQAWIQVSDSHGHELWWPPTSDPITFKVFEDGTEVASESFSSYYAAFPRWFAESPTTTCQISIPGGSFGSPYLEGPLFDPYQFYNTSALVTEHFRAFAPGQYDPRTARMVDFLESYRSALEPLAWGDIADTIQYAIDVTGAGFPGEVVPLKVPLNVHQGCDPRAPASLFFPGHEMGHVRLLHPACGRNLRVPFQEYGESYATMLCLAGFEGMVDSTVIATESGGYDLFYRHLAFGDAVANEWDRTETLQFVEEYVRRNFGWDVHRQVMFGYDMELGALRQSLLDYGFSEWEAIPVLYSQVAGRNLGWLWDLAELGITEARIQEGLDLLAPLAVPGTRLPNAAWLAAPAPNPCRGSAEIRFGLPRTGAVRLEVFDLAGRQVARLADGTRTAGEHAVRWDLRAEGGPALGAGLYFCQLTTGGSALTRRLVVTR